MAEFLRLEFSHVTIQSIKGLVDGMRVRWIKAQKFDGHDIVPKYLTLGYSKSIPFLAVKSGVTKVLSKSDPPVDELEYGLETLLAINDCVFRLVVCSGDLVEKYWRTRVALKDRIEKEPTVFRSPHAAALIRWIQIELIMPSKIQKPTDILRG